MADTENSLTEIQTDCHQSAVEMHKHSTVLKAASELTLKKLGFVKIYHVYSRLLLQKDSRYLEFVQNRLRISQMPMHHWTNHGYL